jgi:hypothetical protein
MTPSKQALAEEHTLRSCGGRGFLGTRRGESAETDELTIPLKSCSKSDKYSPNTLQDDDDEEPQAEIVMQVPVRPGELVSEALPVNGR